MSKLLLSLLFIVSFSLAYGQGNVGIGKNNPTERLDVDGFVRSQRVRFDVATVTPNLTSPGMLGDIMVTEVDSGLYYYNGLQWINLLDQGGGGGGGADSDWLEQGNDVIRYTGNVGIGQASPQYPLHVGSDARINNILSVGFYMHLDGLNFEPTGARGDLYVSSVDDALYYHDGGVWHNLLNAGSDDDWAVLGNDIARFIGNVGIGTGSPTQLLDVTGSVRVRWPLILDPLPYVPFGQEGYLYVNDNDSSLYYHDGSQWINLLQGGGGDTDWIEAGNDAYHPVGNVGIGAFGASEALEVSGNVRLSNLLRITPQSSIPAGGKGDLYVDDNTNTIFFHDGTQWQDLLGGGGGGADTDWVEANGGVYRSSGNVGIGNSLPDAMLDVHGKVIISRDGWTECCGNDASLAISEGTFFTGKRANISFTNVLENDGLLQLNYSDTLFGPGYLSHRFQMLNSTGVGINLDLMGAEIYYGNRNSRTSTRNSAGLRGDAGALSGFFETDSPTPASEWYVDAAGPQHMIDVRYSDPNTNYALQIAGSIYNQELYFRKTNNDPSQGWKRFMTMETYSDNCITQANNGAIDYPLALNVSEGICFLSKIGGGGLTTYGESVSVEPIAGEWNIRVISNNGPLEVCARCIIY